MSKLIDRVGQRFGRLLVIGRSPSRAGKKKEPCWFCRCDCGKTLEVPAWSFVNGRQSCGCLLREKTSARATHGWTRIGRKHPLYLRWRCMRRRCNSPKDPHYKYYGGKGVKVCERWNDFSNFLNDLEMSYRPGLTLERKDVNGDYCPENVRWATSKEQYLNRTDSRIIEYRGERLPLSVWSERCGVEYSTLYIRLKKRGFVADESVFRSENQRWKK